MEFNERLKLMRIRFQTTQQHLANALHIGLSTYNMKKALSNRLYRLLSLLQHTLMFPWTA